ncbi:unnamed protein product [Sphenostylis stenocarpa]|uniref:Uncharacterized protein n=1 Tax=Sphenostylis stenocarpa TaxID=92480 RepID=A0AA86RSC5_9FABA|nr:unnamed protein product [Sphenostylis stenocarpa]
MERGITFTLNAPIRTDAEETERNCVESEAHIGYLQIHSHSQAQYSHLFASNAHTTPTPVVA